MNSVAFICPKCGSKDLNFGSIRLIGGKLSYENIECQRCGHKDAGGSFELGDKKEAGDA